MSKSPFKVGDLVQEVVRPPVKGVIKQIGICPVEGERQFLVEWPDDDSDADTDPQQRWINEDGIEAVNV